MFSPGRTIIGTCERCITPALSWLWLMPRQQQTTSMLSHVLQWNEFGVRNKWRKFLSLRRYSQDPLLHSVTWLLSAKFHFYCLSIHVFWVVSCVTQRFTTFWRKCTTFVFQEFGPFFFDVSTFEKKAICYFETWCNSKLTAQHHIPEDINSQQNRCRNSKFRKKYFYTPIAAFCFQSLTN